MRRRVVLRDRLSGRVHVARSCLPHGSKIPSSGMLISSQYVCALPFGRCFAYCYPFTPISPSSGTPCLMVLRGSYGLRPLGKSVVALMSYTSSRLPYIRSYVDHMSFCFLSSSGACVPRNAACRMWLVVTGVAPLTRSCDLIYQP